MVFFSGQVFAEKAQEDICEGASQAHVILFSSFTLIGTIGFKLLDRR